MRKPQPRLATPKKVGAPIKWWVWRENWNCGFCIGAVEPIILQPHSEGQLFIFEGSRGTAAPGFPRRRLRALTGPTAPNPERQQSVFLRPVGCRSAGITVTTIDLNASQPRQLNVRSLYAASRSTRCTVPVPTPSILAIFNCPIPVLRSSSISASMV